jgi:hypothetical protein
MYVKNPSGKYALIEKDNIPPKIDGNQTTLEQKLTLEALDARLKHLERIILPTEMKVRTNIWTVP